MAILNGIALSLALGNNLLAPFESVCTIGWLCSVRSGSVVLALLGCWQQLHQDRSVIADVSLRTGTALSLAGCGREGPNWKTSEQVERAIQDFFWLDPADLFCKLEFID